jgi:uncharacterized protein (TIGR03435 family)
MRLSLPVLAILLLSAFTSSQAQVKADPAYDVSTVRPSPASSFGHTDVDISSGTLIARGVDLRTLLQMAFDLPRDLIFDLPPWTSNARFDINAKDSTTDPALLKNLPEAKIGQMVEGLLVERFGLKSHTEMREVAAYELVFVRPSPALKQVEKETGDLNIHNRHLEGKGIAIARLVNTFSNELHRPVVDHTGLKGFYDVDLRWRRDDDASNAAAENDPSAPPVLLTALQEQLGLKLRSSKQSVSVVVIDRLTPPAEN